MSSTGMKYPGYFLIVADFIQWAKAQGIPVGPGRGSGAGSLVAYALTITDLDPIRFGLLFERFLNPERVSMPDFDIDFCQDRRDEVIRYVQERYGRDQVAQIITFGTLQARGVLRDVGRVLEMPYGQVDKLCKLVPQNPATPVTLAQAIEDEPQLQAERDGDPMVKRAFDIARKLEGLTRHASTHAAGIVIGDRPLTELVPLYRDPKSDMPVTQFNMKWVEQAGLVKFDFLGLKTLTVLQTAVDSGEARAASRSISPPSRSTTRRPTTCWRARKRSACSSWKAPGMRRALLDMRPDRFEDIIALVALYRPGPMANIPTYCARKHGEEQPDYIHPKLEADPEGDLRRHRLSGTGDAGRADPGRLSRSAQADLLRRAMGKKIRKRDGGAAQAISSRARSSAASSAAQADAIFDLLERFAEYGFNKSHAAAYALVAYQTAYMKANYPVEFLAASMTLDMGNTDKLAEFRAEAERLGIKVEPPSINRSGRRFRGRRQHHLLCARGAEGRRRAGGGGDRRGARRAAISPISPISPPASIRATINKRVLESLAAAGAFDELETNRARVFAAVEAMLGRAQRAHDAAAVGQNELFGGGGDREPMRLPQVEPWLPAERLQREYEAVGFFLSGHPLDDYAAALQAHAGADLGGVLARGASRAPPPAASPRPWCRARSGAPRPATRWASSACPIRPAITRR